MTKLLASDSQSILRKLAMVASTLREDVHRDGIAELQAEPFGKLASNETSGGPA